MKLWIRSADRKHFTEAHGLDYDMDCIVDNRTEEEEYCHKIVDDRGKVLGVYETEQRCLEIIDEIQELLKLGNPENAFMIFNDYDYLSRDEADEILNQARTHKVVFANKEGFSVVMPSVITYEMPEK